MKREEIDKNLNPLEKFYTLKSKDLINDLSEKQKNNCAIISLVSNLILLSLFLFEISLGLIWFVLALAIILKLMYIGLHSNRKWLTYIAILVYIFNAVYYILLYTIYILNITGKI